MNAPVFTAIISAAVSLAVTLITVFVGRSTIKGEREKLERELHRSVTAKLYGIRLDSYPRTMEITEGLRFSRLTVLGESLTEEYLNKVLRKLDTWHATKASFIASRHSNGRVYELRSILREKPEEDGKNPAGQIERIRQAKSQFRGALWKDMQLLFKENDPVNPEQT
jgi:hypothetical protein